MAPRPLTIALIANLYPPYVVGGNELLAHHVVTALRQRGHTVHVLTGHGRQLDRDPHTHGCLDIDLDNKSAIFLDGLPLTVSRLVNWHLFNGRTYVAVRATLQRIQPDLVIAWNLYMASAAPLVAARSGSAPVIAHPADKWLLYSLKDITLLISGTRSWRVLGLVAVRRLLQPLLNHFARPDYILAVSEFIRGLHTAAGYPAAQSKATYLGVPVELFAPQVREHPGRRPWRLAFAGQLWAGKGPQVAIEALRLLRQRPDLPAVELSIFGSGTATFQDYLRRLIAEADLDHQVHLRGFVRHEQLVQEFYSHDLFLFCSIWDEPFSGGLLEAMSTGLPTIATTAGGTPEAVADGVNGLLVPPDRPELLAAAAARLMVEPALYERISAQAAADVGRLWSFEAYIDRLEATYAQIVAYHRPQCPVDLGRPGQQRAAVR